MEKTKFCVHGDCHKEAVIWIGYLVKSRDKVSAGFCDEHSSTECRNVFGKKGCHGLYDKSLQLVRGNYKPMSTINVIEQ